MKLQKWHMSVTLCAILICTIVFFVFFSINTLPVHGASSAIGVLDKEEYFIVNNGYLTGLTNSGRTAARNYNNLHVVVPNGVRIVNSSGFFYDYQTRIVSLVLPTTVTTIEASAFSGCLNLRSVDLANTNVTDIQHRAFYNCKLLTDVTFPTTLNNLGSEAFAGCNNLTNIDLSSTNLNSIFYRTFYNCLSLTNVKFPKRLTAIGTDAFLGCSSLTSIDLSKTNVTTIEYHAFYNCNGLQKIDFPDSLKIIGSDAFSGCSSLKSVDLSNTCIERIEYCTFSSCTSLTDIMLPESLNEVGFGAFMDCNNIQVFICPDSDSYNAYKDQILNSYEEKVSYILGVQFYLTDLENKKSIYYEKILVGEDSSDWHYVNNEWVLDTDYVYGSGLPELPVGYIWQDEYGYELTSARIQDLINESSGRNDILTINATAVGKAKQVITVTGLTCSGKVYDANDVADVDFNSLEYEGIDDGDEVWVELKSGVTLRYDSADVGERIVVVTADDLVLAGADAYKYVLSNSLIIKINATITPAELNAVAVAGTFVYDGELHDTITSKEVILSSRATISDQESIKWKFSYDSKQSWQSTSMKVSDVSETIIYWQVTANNHKSVSGTATFIIQPKVIEVPNVSNTVFIYDGEIKCLAIPESVFYTVTGNQAREEGVYQAKVTLNDKHNYVWSNGLTDDLSFSYIITRKAFTGEVECVPYKGIYDGEVHDAVTVLAPDGEDYIWYFGVNATEYSTAMPQFSKPGTYVVYYKIEFATQYDEYYGSCTVKIEKANLTVEIATHTVLQKTTAELNNFTVNGLVAGDNPSDVIELYCDDYILDTAEVGDVFVVLARIKNSYTEFYSLEEKSSGVLRVEKNPALDTGDDEENGGNNGDNGQEENDNNNNNNNNNDNNDDNDDNNNDNDNNENNDGNNNNNNNENNNEGDEEKEEVGGGNNDKEDNDQPTLITIPVPTASTQYFVYTGNTQIYLPVGFNPELMIIDGNKKSAVGAYTVRVRPQENYIFENDVNYVDFDFVINRANIIMRKNGDEWFNECINNKVIRDLEISLLTKEYGKYKYIEYVDDTDLVIEFDRNLYKALDVVVPNYDTDQAPIIAKDTESGVYKIYYRIIDPNGNHNYFEGAWQIEITNKDSYLVVIFNKTYAVSYGQDFVTLISENIFNEQENYLSVYEYLDGYYTPMALSDFAELVEVCVVTRNANSFGFQNVGTYDIYFEYKTGVNENRSIVYRKNSDDLNTNENVLVIKPVELGIEWGEIQHIKLQGSTLYSISVELIGHMAFLEKDVLNLELIIHNKNGEVIDKITEAGSYTVKAVLTNDYYGNFTVPYLSSIRLLTIDNLEKDYSGLQWLVLGLSIPVVGASVAVPIAIALKRKRKNN